MKPLIGIVSKPMNTESWKRNEVSDVIREALIGSGARVIAIVPQGNSLEHQYEEYPWYENYDLTDREDYLSTVDLCDGILMQGGGVISNYEHLIINYCIQQDIPMLGICCGMTNMAIATGGRVDYSNLDYMYQAHIDQSMAYKHAVRIEKGTLLYEVLGKTELRVNSLHGGQIADPGKYRIAAYSDDGLIEGLEYKENRFNLGVQWHPEFLWKEDAAAKRLFSCFVDQAKKRVRENSR